MSFRPVPSQSHLFFRPVPSQSHLFFRPVPSQSHLFFRPVLSQSHVFWPVLSQSHLFFRPVLSQSHVFWPVLSQSHLFFRQTCIITITHEHSFHLYPPRPPPPPIKFKRCIKLGKRILQKVFIKNHTQIFGQSFNWSACAVDDEASVLTARYPCLCKALHLHI